MFVDIMAMELEDVKAKDETLLKTELYDLDSKIKGFQDNFELGHRYGLSASPESILRRRQAVSKALDMAMIKADRGLGFLDAKGRSSKPGKRSAAGDMGFLGDKPRKGKASENVGSRVGFLDAVQRQKLKKEVTIRCQEIIDGLRELVNDRGVFKAAQGLEVLDKLTSTFEVIDAILEEPTLSMTKADRVCRVLDGYLEKMAQSKQYKGWTLKPEEEENRRGTVTTVSWRGYNNDNPKQKTPRRKTQKEVKKDIDNSNFDAQTTSGTLPHQMRESYRKAAVSPKLLEWT